ncbi:MAG: radical SAM protein [Deltaproteobacteria bacterium]|nr:radical SAM protein [Deltaproteobacteria bacterium]
MKILLINSNRLHQPWPVIPFGLCCVAAALEKAGHNIKFTDLCFERHPANVIKKALTGFDPDLVGVGIRNLDTCVGTASQLVLDEIRTEILRPLRQDYRGPVVLGGPALGINAAEMLDYFDLEMAIQGDGELAVVELAERLSKNQPLNGLKGLVLRQNGTIVEDNAPYRIADLNTLPGPQLHRYINIKKYARFDSPLQVQTKRGCALVCEYCSYRRIEGAAYRLKDPQRIAEEIEAIVKSTGMRSIEFTDSTFNVPLDHAKAVLRAIIGRKLDVRLRTMGINPVAIDDELVELMAKAGMREIDVGAESGSTITLEGLKKGYDREAVIRTGRLLQKHGIAACWFLMLGGPNESAETIRETFKTMDEAVDAWDLVGINVGIRVYKGSPLADKMQRDAPQGNSDHFLSPVYYEPAAISLKEIYNIARAEAARRPNSILFAEQNNPAWVLKFLVLLFKIFKIKRPLWHGLILMRRIEMATGIGFVKRLMRS